MTAQPEHALPRKRVATRLWRNGTCLRWSERWPRPRERRPLQRGRRRRQRQQRRQRRARMRFRPSRTRLARPARTRTRAPQADDFLTPTLHGASKALAAIGKLEEQAPKSRDLAEIWCRVGRSRSPAPPSLALYPTRVS